MSKIIVNNPKQVINGGAKKYYFKVKGLGGLKGDKGDKGDKGEDGKMPTIAQITGQSTTEVMSQKATTDALNAKQATISSSNKLSADLVDDANTTNKFVTSEDKETWNAKQNTITAGENIEISNDVIRAKDTTYTAGNGLNLNGTEFSADTTVLATKEDLEGYYTKPETDNLLAPKLESEVLTELPTTGGKGKLYLTPKSHTTQNATGNPITATVAEEAGKMESFQLDGDTFQQTYTGKNLLPINISLESQGVTANYDQNTGLITIGGTPTVQYPQLSATYGLPSVIKSGSNIVFSTTSVPTGVSRIIIRFYEKTGSAYISCILTTDNPSMAITAEADWHRVKLILDCTPGTAISGTFGLQIETGAQSATDFEPYVGGTASPNPDYPQPIQTVTGEQTIRICGLNIYDKSKDLVGYALTGNGAESAFANWHITEYIPVVGGETYIVTGMTTPGGTAKTCYYDSAKNLIKTVMQQTSPYTITPPSGSAYVRLSVYNNSIQNVFDSDSLQIELGSTAHNYDAYSGTDYPLNLGSIELCKLGKYQDYIWKDGEDWKMHRNIGRYEMTGQESMTWAIQTPRMYINDSILKDLGIYPVYPRSQEDLPTAVTSKFTAKSFKAFYTNAESNGFAMSASGKNFNFGVKTWTSESEAIADITGTIIYYALATPTDTTITDQTLIEQLEAIRTASLQNGANTITNTATGSNLAGDMEVGYYGYNPRNRYDKWLWLEINNEYEQIGI